MVRDSMSRDNAARCSGLESENRGPITARWETPKLRLALEGKQSPSLIIWHLLIRHDLNKSSAFPVTWNQSSSLLKRIVWWMVSKAVERSKSGMWPCQHPLMLEYRYVFKKTSFDWVKLLVFRLILIGCAWTVCIWTYLVHHYLVKNLGKEAKIGHLSVMFRAVLIEGSFDSREMRADLKCERKEYSVNNTLIGRCLWCY